MALDPRIGILNSGSYYAFVNGYDQPETVGTLEQVEIALGIREAPQAVPEQPVAPSAAIRRYNVLMTFEFPAWDEVDGIQYLDIPARSKREANNIARRRAREDGHTIGRRAFFKATEA